MKPFAIPQEIALQGVHLIEASAGTGKTWNISALYVRAVLERELAVDQILVVTFTKAATAELKDRIRARLAEVLSAAEAGVFDHEEVLSNTDPFIELMRPWARARDLDGARMLPRLRLALKSFDQAAIFTLHGFCQRALMDTPFVSGVPFALEVSPSDEDLLEEIVNDYWRVRFASPESAELASLLAAESMNPALLKQSLLIHARYPISKTLWPEADISVPDRSDLGDCWDELIEVWANDYDSFAEALGDLVEKGAFNGRSYNPSKLDTALKSWARLIRGGDPWKKIDEKQKLDLLRASKLTFTQKGKALGLPLPKTQFFTLVDQFLDERQKFAESEALTVRRFIQEAVDTLLPRLRDLKHARRVLTYNDLLSEIHAALLGPQGEAFGAELRRRYPLALVDEFQDTDPIQLSILQSIYGREESCLFMVGDPKQAIYSFRQADLPTYLKATDWADQRWTLSENQRSTEKLIEACNGLFACSPRPFVEEGLHYIQVAKGAKPVPTFEGLGAPLEVWTLPKKDETYLGLEEARHAVAESTATEVVRLLSSDEMTIDGRRVEASDIAILVLSHKEGRRMRRALAKRGVRAVERSTNSVLESSIAEDWRIVLTALAKPKEIGCALAMLATEIFGYSASDIHQLRQTPLGLEHLMTQIQSAHALWQKRGFAEALQSLFNTFDVLPKLLGRFEGERQITNHRHVFEILQAASLLHTSPQALLSHYESLLQASKLGDALEERLESDEGLVRILTVHASKGLEFPIVFCPDLWSAVSDQAPQKTRQPFLHIYHDDDQLITLDYRLEGDGETRAKDERKATRVAERLRLIYVAITRAIGKVYLVSGTCISGPGKSIKDTLHAPLQGLVRGEAAVSTAEAPWHALAETLGPRRYEVRVLPEPTLQPVDTVSASRQALEVLSPPRWIPEKRRLESYSSLQKRIDESRLDRSDWLDIGRDHDMGTSREEDDHRDSNPTLPAGPQIGQFLHGILEEIDFAGPASWRSVIELQRDHFGLATNLGQKRWSAEAALDEVEGLLHRVMSTTLRCGARLPELAPNHIQREREFYISVPRLSGGLLGEALQEAGLIQLSMVVPEFSGHVKGFVDLIFKWEERWYIADWKSNHLGTDPQNYEASALTEEMERHGYGFQAGLYLVFLHRLLKRRLRDYDPQKHLGGVEYLFLRGMNPDWVVNGQPTGIWSWRADPEVIERLDRILSGERV